MHSKARERDVKIPGLWASLLYAESFDIKSQVQQVPSGGASPLVSGRSIDKRGRYGVEEQMPEWMRSLAARGGVSGAGRRVEVMPRL
jgi:hypothetical protein